MNAPVVTNVMEMLLVKTTKHLIHARVILVILEMDLLVTVSTFLATFYTVLFTSYTVYTVLYQGSGVGKNVSLSGFQWEGGQHTCFFSGCVG